MVPNNVIDHTDKIKGSQNYRFYSKSYRNKAQQKPTLCPAPPTRSMSVGLHASIAFLTACDMCERVVVMIRLSAGGLFGSKPNAPARNNNIARIQTTNTYMYISSLNSHQTVHIHLIQKRTRVLLSFDSNQTILIRFKSEISNQPHLLSYHKPRSLFNKKLQLLRRCN